MMTESEIVANLARKLESLKFKTIDLPSYRVGDIPDLVVEIDRFIYLIEVKLGSPDEYLSYELYPNIEKSVKKMTEYFRVQKYIVRGVLITNQKVSWDDLLLSLQIKLIRTLSIPEIIETLRNDVASFKVMLTRERLLLEKKGRLTNLQRVVQLSILLNESEFREIVERFRNNRSPAIRGELCYLLGRWGKSEVIPILTSFLRDSNAYVRSQAREALLELREVMNKQVEVEMAIEENAYLTMEKKLLGKYLNQFAAFYKGELIAIRANKIDLSEAVEEKIGRVRYYIRRISRELPKVKLPRPQN